MRAPKISLTENEQKVLRTLSRQGVMSPGRVSAETWILPGETLDTLRSLSDAGLVLMRDDPDSPDGMLVTLTNQARDLFKM